MAEPFRDRYEAGRILGQKLRAYAGRPDMLVLALPRGGVPVAFEVARALGAPLDVFTVRKLGVPGQPELAMGAIATGGLAILNRAVIEDLNIPDHIVDQVIYEEGRELARRERAYRDDRPPPQIDGKIVILVDDGLATGASMRAAVAALQRSHPAGIIVAVPVAAPEACEQLSREVNRVICAITPDLFMAVGLWYQDFGQVSDDEVRALLWQANRAQGANDHVETDLRRMGEENVVEVAAGNAVLRGNLQVPEGATGIVLFAHGSGSGRLSPRNRFVAELLQDAGIGTLLLDLLTLEEEAEDAQTAGYRFDIDLLARRLIWATDWTYRDRRLARLPLGYFGASTGAAAALIAAGARPEIVRAVVSRGGRPDLAGEALERVQAPTLLIVGGADDAVIDLNEQAAERLQVEHRLEIIPGATHLFPEPGALAEVAHLAADWFNRYLAGIPLEPDRS